MMKRNDKGALVVQLQRCLVELGYPLPRFGVDGDKPFGGFGDETANAMRLFLRDHGHDVDDHDYATVSDAEFQKLVSVNQRLRNARAEDAPNVVDRYAAAAIAGRHHDMGPRPWTEVTAIMFHQTACWLSNSTDDARCDAVGAHRVFYPDGRIFRLHPINRRIVHGHGGNTRCIGYEIDGNFHGVEGRNETLWKPGGHAAWLADAQRAAVKLQVKLDIAEVLAHGGLVKFALAHRQASRDRPGDPGSWIWALVLEIMAEHGLTDAGPGWVFPDSYGGAPICGEWDPSRKDYPY